MISQSTTASARATLAGLLHKTIELGGSDLHLRVDSPPQIRIHGKLQPLEGSATLNAEDTRQLAYSYLTDEQAKRFDENRELDFAIGLEGLSRFRVNIFSQKETIGGSRTRSARSKNSNCRRSSPICAASRAG